MADYSDFEEMLDVRSRTCLRQFFYGPAILSRCYEEDVRPFFELQLCRYREEEGDGTPIFPLAVAALSEAELLRLPNFGKRSLSNVREALSAFGLHPSTPMDYLLNRFVNIGWEWNLLEGEAA